MTNDITIFDIDPDLAAVFKAQGYSFEERLINERQSASVVNLLDRSIRAEGSVFRTGSLVIHKDLVTVGQVGLQETNHHVYLNLKMDNNHRIDHSIMDNSDAMISFVRQQFDAGEITAEEAGCFFVALAGYHLAKAEENARPKNRLEEEKARLDGADAIIDTSSERIDAGTYADAAKACLITKDVPRHSGEPLQMLMSEPTTHIGGMIIDGDEPFSQKGIETDGFTR